MSAKPYKIPLSVLVVIHTPALEVLMMERADKPGFWQSVTGSKDAQDEPFVQTAIREVAEETGIRIVQTAIDAVPQAGSVAIDYLQDWQLSNVYEIYAVWGYRYAPGVTHNTEHVFGLQVSRDIPVVLSPREHINFMWLPYREAADKCFSASNAEAILHLPAYYALPAQLKSGLR
jgi:dATP pyrophosphohydrolase